MQSIGRTLYNGASRFGGASFVFVKSTGTPYEFRPAHGMTLKNPFNVVGKVYQGDLGEYKITGEGYILKVFSSAKVATAEAVEIFIPDDSMAFIPRNHQPEVGLNIMKAPSVVTGAGTAATITSVVKVEENGKPYFKCTLSIAIGALAIGDVLVEADKSGTGAKPIVQNINCFFDVDYSQNMGMVQGINELAYNVSPILHAVAWEERMSHLPTYAKTLNKSRVTGWFEL